MATEQTNKYKSYVLLLILGSTIVRAVLAAFLELGNDEVYYVLYARYPDWSHFDHPLMVGLSIQFFSFNLLFNSEFFIRLSSIIFGAINIWLIFRIGSIIKNNRVGFYASILYVASIYSTVIAGIFILPDTPQSLFWLISIYLMIKVLPLESSNKLAGRTWLLLGLTIGLGILSKYTTVYLWLGIGLFILFYRRDWLKSPYVYLSAIVTLVVSLPILIWNYQNDWVSFVFQGSRVNSIGFDINWNYFITESLGEILYNNPVNFFLIALTFLAFLNGKLYIKTTYLQIILLSTLPLIATFLLVSLTRGTLPHWSALSYSTLIVVVAVWIDQWNNIKLKKFTLQAAVIVMVISLVLGFTQIKFGLFSFGEHEDYHKIGENDPTLDLVGFEQVSKAFSELVDADIQTERMPVNSILIGNNWFPLANYDYYAATQLGMDAYGIGSLDHIHKYAWINELNGGFKKGVCAYYITDSRYYRPPGDNIVSYFESSEIADTVQIYRNGKIAKRAFIYRLKNMVEVPPDPFPKTKN